MLDRKQFLKFAGLALTSLGLPNQMVAKDYGQLSEDDLFFDMSLAEWSFHRALFSGEMDHLDFPATAKHKFGINAVEYVNQFFPDKADDIPYLNEMNSRCSDLGVEQVLIMIDGEGDLAVTNDEKRQQAVENHYKWVKAARRLGCFAIRVNARGSGAPSAQKTAAVDSLGRLAEFASDYDIDIIVENHGGLSSNGKWLAHVMRQVDKGNCGTLPDFGNFCITSGPDGKCKNAYDRYEGVKQMMPFAKDISAKSYGFNDQGLETKINYKKMLTIIHDTGYHGHIGIEYEGSQLSEVEGIRATKNLLMQVGKKLS